MSTLVEERRATFVQVAEVWIPNGDFLTHAAGDYAGKSKFGEMSSNERFAKGEGLPGKAWAEKRPIVLRQFDGSYFKRTEAARAAGLTCAVAIPVFAEDTLKAVLVVFCADDDRHVGAIEVWEEQEGVLRLDGGYYGAATELEEVSKNIAFAKGKGLPGAVWSANTPIMLSDLGGKYGFVRTRSASDAGLKTGIGIPIPVPGEKTYVATLLSAPSTPIARRFEIWDARAARVGSHRKAIRIDGICEVDGPLWPKENPPIEVKSVGVWEGPIGQVLGSGRPHLVDNGIGLPAGYRSMIALPVYKKSELAYIVAWYL